SYACAVVAGRGWAVLDVERALGDVPYTPPTIEGEGGPWVAMVVRSDQGAVGTLVVLDPLGRIRFALPVRHDQGGRARADWYVEPAAGTTLLLGGSFLAPRRIARTGRAVWWVPPLPTGSNDHDGRVLGDDPRHLLMLTRADGPDGQDVFGVDEVLDDEIVWSFSAIDAVERGELAPNPAGEDGYGANAARLDPAGDTVWVSLHLQNRIVAIDRSTGSVLGAVGGGETWTLPDPSWLVSQHDVHVYEDRRLLVLDNGSSRRGFSQVLELRIPTSPGPAELLHQFTEPGWFEPVMGGVEELADGSWLVTRAHCFGSTCDDNDPTARAQLLVVDPETSEVRWRMVMGPEDTTYRARRVDPCVLLGACGI
ncbi:MAG: aryl-sulfate sulfotransferase, partial [Myxococcales bacterium]|nr:aryl-sulfate sulfotransferase [Myxococcales bacterium]